MLRDGYRKDLIHACHNRTVVIDAHLGERENKQLPVVLAQPGLADLPGGDWPTPRSPPAGTSRACAAGRTSRRARSTS